MGVRVHSWLTAVPLGMRVYACVHAAACMSHRCRDSSLRVGKHYLDGPEPDDGKALFFLTVAAKVCPRPRYATPTRIPALPINPCARIALVSHYDF